MHISCIIHEIITMSSFIDDIEDAVEFGDKWEQVMKAERVISWRFNHVNTNHYNCISTKVPFPITIIPNITVAKFVMFKSNPINITGY